MRLLRLTTDTRDHNAQVDCTTLQQYGVYTMQVWARPVSPAVVCRSVRARGKMTRTY